MANEEQLSILKQGVDVWNKWRMTNLGKKIELSGVDLSDSDLSKVDFGKANLTEVNLNKASLARADLNRAILVNANLCGINLNETNLGKANLSGCDLSQADIRNTNFNGAILIKANLNKISLRKTDLRQANLIGATLREAHFELTSMNETNLENAILGATTFINIDLGNAIGLEKVRHATPSSLGTDTIRISNGRIPGVFLRGCGLSDWEIESAKLYNSDLTNEEIIKIQYRIYDLRATQAIQISPLFISYSHTDKSFVDHLDSALTQKGIRFWRDIHDAVAGRLETQVDHAMRLNPTVLLILSKNSITSDWVEHEVRMARQLEKELGRDALCPIALDDDWKSSPWPKRVMEQVMEYNILDFSGWENKFAFERNFAKLLNGLDLFYKKPEA